MSTKKQFFVTGTDTDAGKTYFSAGLLAAGKRRNLRTIGLKPVAAGAVDLNGVLRNDDALSLMEQTIEKLSYEQINPVLFAQPIAPHIAAIHEGREIAVSRLEGYIKGALLNPHDLAVVEGAGGWRVPLSDRAMMSDLAQRLNFPVIMVVNMKLGCINHALLTAEAIMRDGLTIAGWVANFKGEMGCYSENVFTLSELLPAPLLGELPREEDAKKAESVFNLVLGVLFDN